jgi:type I restriction enzyme M protein
MLDDSKLPVPLAAEWHTREENQGKPFPSFALMFAYRGKAEGDSAYSWTIDFAARRAKAREEMEPHLAEVEKLKLQIVEHKEKLKALKKTKATEEEIDSLSETIKATEKAAREAQSKADNIDAAVYDLKAVNPNDNSKADTRTTAEIIESIEEHGKTVSIALARLKGMLDDAKDGG